MCSKMDILVDKKLSAFAGSDWIEALIKEYEEEVKVEARWPTVLLQSTSRKMVWSICTILGVNSKGVPGSACRLLERYLSRHVRSFLEQPRDTEEWDRYKDLVASRFYLLMVSCVQLAAKMNDLLAPLNASSVRTTLLKQGIEHTTAEIVKMELYVYNVLDYRLPLWSTLEISQFLAIQVGLHEALILEALELVMNLTEFHRDALELYMKKWTLSKRRQISTLPRPNRVTLHNLHMCAGAVSATARYMHYPRTDLAQKLAILLRTNSAYIKAISKNILVRIIPEKSYIPNLKKRRLI